MYIKDIMTRNFKVLRPDDTLYTAAKIIRNYRLNAIPVTTTDNTLIGIFTRSNFLDALMSGYTLNDRITEIYTRKVLSVIHEEMPYDEVVSVTKSSLVSTGVVVDNKERVVGLFTKQDMLITLFQQEEKYNAELKAVYRAIPHGLISVDSNGTIKIFNPAAEKILGYKKEHALNTNIRNIIQYDNLQDVLKHGKIITGHKYTFNNAVTLLNCVPILGENGTEGAIIIFQDITDIEKTVHELESINRLYQILKIVLDTAYGGIVAINEEGKILFINDAYIDFFFESVKIPLYEDKNSIAGNKKIKNMLKGRHIEEIFPDSRLLKVLKTGNPEINSVETFRGIPFVVSRLPVIKDNKILGAVGKIIFKDAHQLQDLVSQVKELNNRVQYYRKELKKARDKQYSLEFNNIVGISNCMNKLKNDAFTVARGNSNVLICGESGTGKELFARAIHQASIRKNEPFVKVNCSAIPENLLESELFGYDPGAFTGAAKNGKQGRFEMANKGTIFLDEIGDMPLSMQSKLLHVLQEQRFERVGGTSTIQVDVRVISATNNDLEEKIQKGEFRADLYYRLKVIQLNIPPLRFRKEDILPLTYSFLEKYNRIMNVNIKNISYEAMQILQNYDWPGNVRELENTIERALNFASQGTLRKEHLPPEIIAKTTSSVSTSIPDPLTTPEMHTIPPASKEINEKGDYLETPFEKNYSYYSHKQLAEKEAILNAINQARGNKTKAAQKLGISRSWLYEKMKRLGIN